MKRGFTLLELIVVIIIISILAGIALGNYQKIVERSRATEAKNNLGTLRALELAYYQENSIYINVPTLNNEFNTTFPSPGNANSAYYFVYQCTKSSPPRCFAQRSTDLASKPPIGSSYIITMYIENGTIEGGP